MSIKSDSDKMKQTYITVNTAEPDNTPSNQIPKICWNNFPAGWWQLPEKEKKRCMCVHVCVGGGGGDMPQISYRKYSNSDLVFTRRWVSSCPGDKDGILLQFLHLHVGEVTDHVRQEVESRVPNFIQQLLTHRAPRHHATGVGRLGQNKLAVWATLNDGEAYVVPGQRKLMTMFKTLQGTILQHTITWVG